jgi:hypothetical protein
MTDVLELFMLQDWRHPDVVGATNRAALDEGLGPVDMVPDLLLMAAAAILSGAVSRDHARAGIQAAMQFLVTALLQYEDAPEETEH